jgi:hypothetical protein
VFLGNVSYIIKYIGHLCLFQVKHIMVNKEFVFNLNVLVLKGGGGAICKRVRVFQLDCN